MLRIEVAGHTIWVVIWVGILLLGGAGLIGALTWGPRTRWRNLDEICRGLGTVSVAAGMLLLLLGWHLVVAIFLMFVSLAMFVAAAFVPEFARYLPPED